MFIGPIEVVSDTTELAERLQQRANQLRATANRWPWGSRKLIIEAEVWEQAADIVGNALILKRTSPTYKLGFPPFNVKREAND